MKLLEFFDRLRLQQKFIILTTCAIIVVMSSVGYVAVKRERSILYAEVEKQGRLLGETLAIPIINDLIYERLGLVEEGGLLDNYIVEIFNRQDADLLYIAILDEDGKVISHNTITEYGKVYSDPLTLKALEADETIIQPFTGEGRKAIDFGVPLSIGKKRWGTLKFGISLAKVEQEIYETVMKIVILTVFLLISGFIIILLLSRRFISPITQLAGVMEKATGDYLDLKVEVKGHDELAVLGDRFNSMIERIRQANEELRKVNEKMVQSEKLASIGILASGVAHEINNPLGGLFNCVRTLSQPDSDPQTKERYFELLREGLERIETTVRKLLGFSQRRDGSKTSADLNALTSETLALLEYKLKNPRLILAIELDPRVPRLVLDQDGMRQVLLNILLNSLQAMPEGGKLSVRTFTQNGSVMLEVRDTGVGIEREHLGKIFDPFFTTKPVGEGTGLGLSVSYGIVKSHGGEISAESEVGRGTTFTVSLPVSADSAA